MLMIYNNELTRMEYLRIIDLHELRFLDAGESNEPVKDGPKKGATGAPAPKEGVKAKPVQNVPEERSVSSDGDEAAGVGEAADESKDSA